MSYSTSHSEYLETVLQIARGASDLIMGFVQQGFATQHKDDKSPVTEADLAANAYITEALQKMDSNIPIIAEEDALPMHIPERFWLVDPLDGTRAFVAGEDEFTVNIGLIEATRPVFGVLAAPAKQLLYYGGDGMGAFRSRAGGAFEKIQVRTPPKEGLTVVRSKSHPSKKTEIFLSTLQIHALLPSSSALKLCQVAEGVADVYPRFGRTMEWDTAAGHAILNAAGGEVITEDGAALRYGKSGFDNPAFIAYGKRN